ncbi:MAG TPA: peroxiredoxin [Kofleriaceae bacterium]|nr:peroxiredoxin [Kofleriaceae bacterium]
MKPGDRAPDFELPANNGRTVKLADYRGKQTIVLYFYPKDETPGCTAEACSFRDEYEDFKAAGAEVIGVSDDSVESHDKFAAHHHLPFVLATDEHGALREKMGVKKTLGMLKGRVTFVIDKEGVIRDRFDSQIRFKAHVHNALDLVKQLEHR